MRWKNRATFEVWRHSVHEVGDELPEVLHEWREAEGEGFLRAFAEQLQEDFGEFDYWDPTDPGSRLYAMALRALLERVDWREVASQLVEYANRGTYPRHDPCSKCWCRKPVRAWPKPVVSDPAQVVPVLQAAGGTAAAYVSQDAGSGRMDAATLFSVFRDTKPDAVQQSNVPPCDRELGRLALPRVDLDRMQLAAAIPG